VRNTGEIFEFVNDVKEIFNNINSFTSIYSDAGAGAGDIKFSEKYEIFAERTDRKIVTDMKNSVYP
jgi:hypothetical protein